MGGGWGGADELFNVPGRWAVHGEAQKRGGNCLRSHSRKSQSSLEFCLPNPYPDSPRLRPCGRPVSEGPVPHTRLTPLLHKSQGLGWASWESTADSASWLNPIYPASNVGAHGLAHLGGSGVEGDPSYGAFRRAQEGTGVSRGCGTERQWGVTEGRRQG